MRPTTASCFPSGRAAGHRLPRGPPHDHAAGRHPPPYVQPAATSRQPLPRPAANPGLARSAEE